MDAVSLELMQRIQQIKEFSTNNSINYHTMLDILEDNNPSLSDIEISQVVAELAAAGISIISADDSSNAEFPDDEPENFVPANVRVEPRTLTVWNLMERLRYGEIDLQTGFQRHGDLWTLEQQSRLIESLMLKIPLPAFYFDASHGEYWKIIDGLQRLSAFRRFLVGVPGGSVSAPVVEYAAFSGFQYLKEFNGLTFQQLPRQYVRRIQESQIIAYTVEKGTPDTVVFNIFQRINTGGLQLTAQEIRHALYQGKATRLTEELAASEEFLEATNSSIQSKRMLDQEYVTRFIAFTELDYKQDYKGNIHSFLNRALKKVNAYPDKELDRIRRDFKRIMKQSTAVFGRFAFRRYDLTWRRGPVNKALFELWVICFKEMPEENLNFLIENRGEFLFNFQDLLQEPDFIASIKSNDASALTKRIYMTKKILEVFSCSKP